MKQPKRVLLAVVALVALLPHAPKLLKENDQERGLPVAVIGPAATEPMKLPQVEPQQVELKTTAATSDPAQAEPEKAKPEQQPHPWDVLPIAEPEYSENPLAGLEEAYMVEAFDADWAMPIEANFHSVLETAKLFDTEVEQAECRTTLCRFAVVHKNSGAQDAFVEAFLQSPLLSLSQGSIAHHSRESNDGSISAVYFLARNEIAHVQN